MLILGHQRTRRLKVVPKLSCVWPSTESGCEVTAVVCACWPRRADLLLLGPGTEQGMDRQTDRNNVVYIFGHSNLKRIVYTRTTYTVMTSVD